MEEYFELLQQYALDNENYQGWRQVHTKMFGEIFSASFSENEEARIHLSSALIDITNRQYKKAMPKLSILETLCTNEHDCATVDYFLGLNYEFLENEHKMNEYYEKLRDLNVEFVYPLSLHPFYRTAKFAQREAECSKAIFYYQKALTFYSADSKDHRVTVALSHIVYDMATVYLYMHKYEECKNFLALSIQYDRGNNQHRTYVTAILCAVEGEIEKSEELLKHMSPFLQENCKPMIKAISEKKDLHYFVVSQNRSQYSDFWKRIVSNKEKIEGLLQIGKSLDAEAMISESLSTTFSFMKKMLVCRVEASDGSINICCKNDHVKTLAAEHEALFATKPASLHNWTFLSVNEFESY